MPRLELLVMQRRDAVEMLGSPSVLCSDDVERRPDHGWLDRIEMFVKRLNVEIEVEKKRCSK